jgi:hypothetical protein
LVTNSPTRCKLPLPIVQATQAAKSSDFGDSYIFECPLWVISGHRLAIRSTRQHVRAVDLVFRGQVPLPL